MRDPGPQQTQNWGSHIEQDSWQNDTMSNGFMRGKLYQIVSRNMYHKMV